MVEWCISKLQPVRKVMTKNEFSEIIAYLEAGIGRPIAESDDATRMARMRVYYDLLEDMPIETLRVAVKRVVLTWRYPSFPSVAEIRKFAVNASRGTVSSMMAGEAWAMATKAIAKVDVDIPGSVERHLGGLPEIVRRTINAFGFKAMYTIPSRNLEAARAQFRVIFEEWQDREVARGILPTSVADKIEEIGEATGNRWPAKHGGRRVMITEALDNFQKNSLTPILS